MNTERMQPDPMERNDVSEVAWLQEHVKAKGRNGSYLIVAKLLASSGESQIYNAIRLSDQKLLIAKVYTGSTSYQQQLDRNDIRESLLKIKDSVQYGLLPLLDICMIENKDHYRADVDIMPFCEKGNLCSDNYKGIWNYSSLRNIIVPSLIKALHYLHENGWVHRDVKPENIYVLDNKIVLGDFGISVRVSSDSSATNKTEARRGTPGYTAPEVRIGYSKIASDYFSLGCTIATLYNQGEHVYATALKEGDVVAFYRTLEQYGLPLNCPDGEADIQTLVDALTLNENNRAGYDDVVQWLKNPEAFVKKWSSCRKGLNRTFEMRFEECVYFSEKDLTEAFLQNWGKALAFFYEDDMFVNYIKAKGHEGCNVAGQILRNPSKSELGMELDFAKFLHHFNKLNDDINPPIYWRTRKYESLSEIAAAIKAENANAAPDTDILDLLKSGFLSWKAERSKPEAEKTPEDRKRLETLKSLEKYAASQPFLTLETFSLLLDDSEGQESRTTEQIVSDILSNEDMFYKLCVLYCTPNRDSQVLQARTDVFDAVFAPLILKGHSANMFELAKAFDQEPNQVKRAIDAYLTFEEICTDKKFVRRYFYEHGPYAYLHWLTKNMDLYEVFSDEMWNTVSRIRAFTFNDTMPIRKQLGDFSSLEALNNEFYANLQDSILNMALGNMSGKTIRPKVLDAFYILCNAATADSCLLSAKKIPIGYFRALGYLPGKHLVEDNVNKLLDYAASDIMNISGISEASVEDALGSISGGLSYLFGMYCTNTLGSGDVVQYAMDTVNNTKSGNLQLGKAIAETASPAYFCRYLYSIIDDSLQNLLKKQLLEKWDKLKCEYESAYEREYEALLNSHAVSYDILAQRNPYDYRPIWFALREKTAGFDVGRLFGRVDLLGRAKNNFEYEKKAFDSAVRKIQSRKIREIQSRDFKEIIQCALNAQKAWENLKNAFGSYNRNILPEYESARDIAGADAPALQFTWDKYIKSIDTYKGTDYTKQKEYWTGEMWEAEGLCRRCGGKLGLFGKCKKCGCTS